MAVVVCCFALFCGSVACVGLPPTTVRPPTVTGPQLNFNAKEMMFKKGPRDFRPIIIYDGQRASGNFNGPRKLLKTALEISFPSLFKAGRKATAGVHAQKETTRNV
jgi:hypothetical protein